MKKPFLRHPLFWTTIIVASLGAGLFSYYYFSSVLPLSNLKITMSRSQALTTAHEIAQSYDLGPQNYKEAVYFDSDSDAQNYFELERGGAEAWKKFMQGTDYYPYTWVVRHFKEGDPHEATFKFTPDGKPYGFIETIAESTSGAALSSDEARIKAEAFISLWGIDLSSYKLKDRRREIRAHGRVDHTFIYEKSLENLGQAHYLLTIVVTGDRVTTVDHSLDIPEAFKRSFTAMRTLNDTIYYYASLFTYLVYLLVGCLGAILLLLRKNWLLPKQALYAGVGVALALFIGSLNQFPLLWFNYDTALSSYIFIFQSILSMLVQLMFFSIMYTATFLAAEGLTRRAFGSHMQLWSAWKIPAAGSYTMLGKTIISYCIVALLLAFVVLLYGVGMHYFGWWSPSGALTDPNILSSYVPALSVVSKSIAAGFWEECLFRAVPIASCALIGKKIGYPKTAIAMGLLFQPLIFGAAHANYPSMPGYVRIVELYLPFFGFGLLYLFFGLIPVIFAHVLYDALLYSLPLFVSDAPGMILQRALVLAAAALPIFMVLYSRYKTGRWMEMPDALYNGAWQPVPATLDFEKSQTGVAKGAERPFTKTVLSSFFIVAGLSFVAWVVCTSFTRYIPSLKITKSDAVILAEATIGDPKYKVLPYISIPGDDQDVANQHTFIWQQYGKDAYKKLVGSYLSVPVWSIRFARFAGDLQERAEEYQIGVKNHGIMRSKHILTQAAPGAKLDEATARAIALDFISKKTQTSIDNLHEIAAQSDALPQRIDWRFIFAEQNIVPNQTNKDLGRLAISLAGNTVSDWQYSVHIPEEWERTARLKKALVDCIGTLRWFAWLFTLMIAASLAVILWRKSLLDLKKIVTFGLAYAFIALLCFILNFPQTAATFTTAKSFDLQSNLSFVLESTKTIFETLILSLLAGTIFSTTIISAIPGFQTLLAGIAAGLCWAAVIAAISLYIYPSVPWFPTMIGASASLPFLPFAWKFLASFIKQALYLEVLAYFAAGSSIREFMALAATALLITPYDATATLAQWLLALLTMAGLISALYFFILRNQPKTIPIATAVPYLLGLAREYTSASFPGSQVGCIIAALSIMGLSFYFSKIKDKKKPA